MYPKLRAKYGDSVPYDRAPKQHMIVEFAFDVLLVAHGGYKLQAYHDFIGFKVSKPLLERAFKATYGLEMKDLFLSEDLAIGTYRHAVGSTIPNVTKVAWEKKQDEIQKMTPGVVRDQFVLTLPRTDYEREYGKDYRKPGFFARILGALYAILPKIGPLRPLAFKVPTPEAEKFFLDSLARTRSRYAAELEALRAGRLDLPNVNFDTGKPSAPGEYPLADETMRELEKRTPQEQEVTSGRAGEVDEATPRVGAHEPDADAVADVEPLGAALEPSFDRRRHETDPRALGTGARDDRVERLADLRRQPQRGRRLAR